MITQQQIELLQHTFARCEPILEDTGDLFYHRLFEMAPALSDLFTGDMKAQSRMLVNAISLTVRGLATPDSVKHALQEIGRRHIGYGATPADFDVFGAALQQALAETLGDDFSQPVREAWGEAFAFIASEMKAAVKQ